MDVYKSLKNLDLFKSLDEPALRGLSKNALYRRLEQKEILFNEGFEGKYFYILLKGAMRLYKTSYDGKESTIKIIHPGEFFAEAILFGRKEYPVSAAAVEMSEVIAIHRESFWKMMDNPGSRDIFVGALFEKLRFLAEQIHYLSSHDVEDRFFRFIINNYGKKYYYNITIPKKDIASAIGTIPETFSRLILRLTKTGLIAWKQDSLIIKDGFWENNYSE
ncbi:MAG: Crp/Fnr family transcriptional regulator [Spirochaetes bacterium]|nr:Crp/Fnr family transcriptional regulator [Spirochaetota bacterium]